MTVYELQQKILKIKKEKDIAILAHSYVAKEITEVADVVGDSFALSRKATEIESRNIILCGVHFMAETAKMLNPDKRVFLANEQAGCPMAEQFMPEEIEYFKNAEPDRAVVAYINTTAALKAVCDVCVTSSSAVNIVKKMEARKILFIPDCNLGAYVQQQVPEKDIKLLRGGCPIHAAITEREALEAKERHPKALLLVHPECVPEVVKHADYVGSTSGIMEFAKKSDCKEFIIGTEISITELLQYDCPDKKFYPLSKNLVCRNMKITTLVDVYNTAMGIDDGSAFEIKMTAEEIEKARKPIDEMLRLG
ncbi:MAG: quinolinate synthase NadA [Ruminiclostridium sp.]